jgi:lipoprotein-anchoring transpeptidase ErfK/SrfK
VSSRRIFIIGLVCSIASLPLSRVAQAHQKKKKRKRFSLNPKFEPRTVTFSGYTAGTIVIDRRRHFLFLVQANGSARRYGIGIGKAGLQFQGTARIARKAKWPSWRPTDAMIRREPRKYAKFAKGVPGGPKNPLGARALYLYRGGRDTYFRIHGTTEPRSIGRSVSNGCIRMLNAHVKDLYKRVPVGTKVFVI